jgi:hypothetical protein
MLLDHDWYFPGHVLSEVHASHNRITADRQVPGRCCRHGQACGAAIWQSAFREEDTGQLHTEDSNISETSNHTTHRGC